MPNSFEAIAESIRRHSKGATNAYALNRGAEPVGVEMVLGNWIETNAKTVGVAIRSGNEWQLRLAILRESSGREFVKFVPEQRLRDSGDAKALGVEIFNRFFAMGDALVALMDVAAGVVDKQRPR